MKTEFFKDKNKEKEIGVTDFIKYSAELKILHTTKYFHLAVGIDCKYYKET